MLGPQTPYDVPAVRDLWVCKKHIVLQSLAASRISGYVTGQHREMIGPIGKIKLGKSGLHPLRYVKCPHPEMYTLKGKPPALDLLRNRPSQPALCSPSTKCPDLSVPFENYYLGIS